MKAHEIAAIYTEDGDAIQVHADGGVRWVDNAWVEYNPYNVFPYWTGTVPFVVIDIGHAKASVPFDFEIEVAN